MHCQCNSPKDWGAVFRHTEAVIFDMDGTLIDSEINTERAARSIVRESGLDGSGFDYTTLHGVTWEHATATLREHFPSLPSQGLAAELQRRFHRLCVAEPPPFIAGAVDVLRKLRGRCRIAIGTSSTRESVDSMLKRPELKDCRPVVVSAEDYQRSKPAPDCYLTVAAKLDVKPKHCLVFEDSIAGLTAARSAGMRVAAVLHRCPKPDQARLLADEWLEDYREVASWLDATQSQNGEDSCPQQPPPQNP